MPDDDLSAAHPDDGEGRRDSDEELEREHQASVTEDRWDEADAKVTPEMGDGP